MSPSTILATEQLDLRGIAIEVQRKRIKNINLKVYPPDGHVAIAAPLHLSLDTVRLFAVSKLSWIEKKRAQFHAQERQSPREYVSGETHYYYGQPYRLQVHPTATKQQVELHDRETLHLYIRPTATIDDRERLLYTWYREQLKAIVPAIVAKWEPKMGIRVDEVRVKRMKTKWGTCNTSARRIWLNTELMRTPPHCLEYVVVHELTHLLERLHSDRFYRLLEQFYPTWKSAKLDLKRTVLATYTRETGSESGV